MLGNKNETVISIKRQIARLFNKLLINVKSLAFLLTNGNTAEIRGPYDKIVTILTKSEAYLDEVHYFRNKAPSVQPQ